MTTFGSHDFTLFPQSRKMAEARVKQSYYDPMTLDPGMFSFPVDNLAHYGQTDLARLHHSYYDTQSLFHSAQLQKAAHFSSLPTTPPSVSASHSAEPHIPTGSAASGPSIASASSSAMGSPYSGTAQNFHENWVNTNHGLGLPAAAMGDLFPNEYFGSAVDMEILCQEKFPDTYVGMFRAQSQPVSILTRVRSLIDPAGATWTWCPRAYGIPGPVYLFLF